MDNSWLLDMDAAEHLDRVLLDRADLAAEASAGLMWKRDLSCEMLQMLVLAVGLLMRLGRAESSYQRICF